MNHTISAPLAADAAVKGGVFIVMLPSRLQAVTRAPDLSHEARGIGIASIHGGAS